MISFYDTSASNADRMTENAGEKKNGTKMHDAKLTDQIAWYDTAGPKKSMTGTNIVQVLHLFK